MTGHTRRALFAVLLLSGALSAASCAETALSLAQKADMAQNYDLAVAEYTKAVKQHPNDQEAQLGLQRAKARASNAHLVSGRRLYNEGKYDEALLDLQIAAELNPTNPDADREVQAVRKALRLKLSAPEGGQTPLESLLQRSRDFTAPGNELPNVTLGTISTGRQVSSRDLYLMIATLGKISVTFDSSFREAPTQASLLANMTLRQALDAVARATSTFYQVSGPAAIVVAPDTPAKRREYAQEEFRTFYIRNADLKETVDALRVVGDLRQIQPITGTNAITVRDTPERLQAIDHFIATFDKAKPEVAVDVQIIEVDRSKLLEYGLQIASPGSPGINGSMDVNRQGLTLQDLKNLSASDVLVAAVPALYYRLLSSDSSTRTLANPQLRMTDGTAASASFGEDVPIPVTTITPIVQTGPNIQPQTTFQYRTIGVNIKITPRTHSNDDITLALDINLSSQTGTSGFGGLPTFGTRNVLTTIRLRDGETNLLAGLIRDDERYLKEGIPGLSNVPGLSHIFTHDRKEATQTDVVVMLTPHIIRVLDLTDEDLRPLRVPREGGGPALIEGAPVQPPPIIREGGPGPLGASGTTGRGRSGGPPPSLPVAPGVPAGLPVTPVAAPGKVIKN
ncbi:MAG TPA: secretin N-terminal domain-containing protein [Vicinamibacterales bacterium]|nr:secretin N-terminal domain-containing protein [Vicinamibacterales bacterium]